MWRTERAKQGESQRRIFSGGMGRVERSLRYGLVRGLSEQEDPGRGSGTSISKEIGVQGRFPKEHVGGRKGRTSCELWGRRGPR